MLRRKFCPVTSGARALPAVRVLLREAWASIPYSRLWCSGRTWIPAFLGETFLYIPSLYFYIPSGVHFHVRIQVFTFRLSYFWVPNLLWSPTFMTSCFLCLSSWTYTHAHRPSLIFTPFLFIPAAYLDIRKQISLGLVYKGWRCIPLQDTVYLKYVLNIQWDMGDYHLRYYRVTYSYIFFSFFCL